MAKRKLLKIGIVATAVIAAVVGISAWQVLRVEDIPEELEALDTAATPRELVVPGTGGLPDLNLSKPGDKTTLVMIMGAQAWQEARDILRALNRWELPDTTEGYIVGDAAGFALFRAKVEEIMAQFKRELRFPLYVDFDGAVLERYKLPKGHHGLVVLDPRREVVLRHSGPMEEAEIEALRVAIGGTEPPPGPPAPPFSVGPLDNGACKGKPCAIAFLGRPLTKAEIPGIEGGRDAKSEDIKEIMDDPSLRMAMMLIGVERYEKEVGAVAVGKLTDVELEHWTVVEDGDAARAAFDVKPDEAALIVMDAEGRVAFREVGLIPQWKLSVVRHVLGAEFKRGRDD